MARVRHRDGQVDSTAWREGKRKQIAAINLSACKSHTIDRHTEERGCNITGCVRVTAADKEDTGSPSGANEKWETKYTTCGERHTSPLFFKAMNRFSSYSRYLYFFHSKLIQITSMFIFSTEGGERSLWSRERKTITSGLGPALAAIFTRNLAR